MPLFHEQKKPDNKDEIVTVEVKLIAPECGVLIACLDWVHSELVLMENNAQKLIQRKKDFNKIPDGEKVAVHFAENAIGVANISSSEISYLKQCLISSITNHLDTNAQVSKQDRDKFSEEIQSFMKSYRDLQDGALKVKSLLTMANIGNTLNK